MHSLDRNSGQQYQKVVLVGKWLVHVLGLCVSSSGPGADTWVDGKAQWSPWGDTSEVITPRPITPTID